MSEVSNPPEVYGNRTVYRKVTEYPTGGWCLMEVVNTKIAGEEEYQTIELRAGPTENRESLLSLLQKMKGKRA